MIVFISMMQLLRDSSKYTYLNLSLPVLDLWNFPWLEEEFLVVSPSQLLVVFVDG